MKPFPAMVIVIQHRLQPDAVFSQHQEEFLDKKYKVVSKGKKNGGIDQGR